MDYHVTIILLDMVNLQYIIIIIMILYHFYVNIITIVKYYIQLPAACYNFKNILMTLYCSHLVKLPIN